MRSPQVATSGYTATQRRAPRFPRGGNGARLRVTSVPKRRSYTQAQMISEKSSARRFGLYA